MRLFSWNVNGVRAATKKGLFEWLEHESPDILCIQETKAHVDQLGSEILNDHGYNAYWHSGERRGYSGVATFCKNEPLYVQEGLGIDKYDVEGILIRLSLISMMECKITHQFILGYVFLKMKKLSLKIMY